jgi:hypothetical protein
MHSQASERSLYDKNAMLIGVKPMDGYSPDFREKEAGLKGEPRLPLVTPGLNARSQSSKNLFKQ